MEKSMKKIVRESIYRVLNEGANDTKLLQRWENIKEQIGPERFLDELWNALNEDELRENIEYIERVYEIEPEPDYDEDFDDDYDDDYEDEEDVF